MNNLSEGVEVSVIGDDGETTAGVIRRRLPVPDATAKDLTRKGIPVPEVYIVRLESGIELGVPVERIARRKAG